MKNIIALCTLFIGSLFSFDRFFDISLTTDFANLKQRSHVDFNSQAAFPFSNRAFLLNPRLSIFFDGTMDVSVATGLRHEFQLGTLGHHLFWDSSGTKEAHFHQVGHSLDFLTPKFDFRMNYYHPVTKEFASKRFLFSPHKWIETEVIWKNKICQIGIGPKYDIFKKEWGAQSRIVFPFKFFSIGSLLSYDNSNKVAGCFSLSFRLFSTPRKSFLQSPICHRSRVQYSKQIIFVPPPEIEKRPEVKADPAYKKAVEQVIKTSEVEPVKEVEGMSPPLEEGEIIETSAVTPIEEPKIVLIPQPAPRTWWDFFFHRGQNPQSMISYGEGGVVLKLLLQMKTLQLRKGF